MKQFRKNELGFSAVEVVMVVAIVALLGVVGWLVYKDHHKTTAKNTPIVQPYKTTTPAPKANAPTAANPYAGWNTYTLKLEKITFRYPSTWQLTDKSDSNDDYEILTGPLSGTNNLTMVIGAGAAVSDVNLSSGPIVESDSVTFNSHPAFLDTDTSGGYVVEMLLSQSSSKVGDLFPTQNITFNSENSRILVQVFYSNNSCSSNCNPNINYGAAIGEPLSMFENDVNYKDAKLVVDSMSY